MRILIDILVSDSMVQDKKSKKNDIEKLRMILDSPSDPKVKKIVDKHERNLETIRARLSNEKVKTDKTYRSSDFLKKSGSLEPRVQIHEKEEIKPRKIEKEPVKTEIKDEKFEEHYESHDLFEDEELIEIEKADVAETEFVQVKPKDMEKIFEKTEKQIPAFTPKEDKKEFEKEIPEKGEKLPEWEQVEDTEFREIKEQADLKEEKPVEKFTEVKPVEKTIQNQELVEEKEEDIPRWEPVELSHEKEEVESPLEFKEEKPIKKQSQEVPEEKIETPMVSVTESKTDSKMDKKELKRKLKEEKKFRIIEGKRKKKEAKQQKKELKKIQKQEKKKTGMIVEPVRQDKKVVDEPIQKTEFKTSDQEYESQIEEQLKEEKTIDDSSKKGLKKQKKKVKKETKIKKEDKIPKSDKNKFKEEKNIEETTTEWESYDIDEIPEETIDISAYTHGEFTLYKKDIKTVTGKKRTIHFFAKSIPDEGQPVNLPDGYEVKVNKRTGLPYLKKK